MKKFKIKIKALKKLNKQIILLSAVFTAIITVIAVVFGRRRTV